MLAVVILTGCYAYRPAPLTPAPGADVRVVLVTATDLPIRASRQDSAVTTCAGVLEAAGRVVAAAADTVVLELGSLHSAGGAIPGVSEHLAFIPTSRIASIAERRFQAGRTALTGVGVLTLAGGAFIVILIVILTRAAAG